LECLINSLLTLDSDCKIKVSVGETFFQAINIAEEISEQWSRSIWQVKNPKLWNFK